MTAKLLAACLLLWSSALLASSLPLNFERIKVWGGTQDVFVALGVSVGNPHTVNYNLTLDFDNGQSVLIGVNSTRPQCVVSNRNYFDLMRSTTFRQIKRDRFQTPPYAYGRYCYAFQPSDGSADVTFGRDDFQIADGVYHAVPFGVLTSFNGSWSPDWPSDGVLGFNNAPTYRALSAARSLASGNQNCAPELQVQGLCNSATIALNIGGRTPGMHAGDITFGEIPDFCGKVQEVEPAAPNQSWSFTVLSTQFGALSDQDHGGKAYLQWSSSDFLLEMPQALLDAMMLQVGARKNSTSGIYYVDCGRTKSLPTLTLQVYYGYGGTLNFSPAHYVQQIPKAKQCPVLLRGSAGPIWAVGNRIAQVYCLVLNFGNQKLGFATRG